MAEELLTTKKINEEYPQFSLQKLTFAIRNGQLKATKRGNTYFVTRKNLNLYLGIENSDEELQKNLEIEKLKNELKLKEQTILTLKNLLKMANDIVD